MPVFLLSVAKLPAKPRLLMPAIYRFELAYHPLESSLNWVLASEILIAINYSRYLEGKTQLTAKEVIHEYPKIFLTKNVLSTINHTGELGCYVGTFEECFDRAVQHSDYIPVHMTELLSLIKT